MARLERTCVITASQEVVFDFHTDPRNLARITPSMLTVTATPHGEAGVGQTIAVDVRAFGVVPQRWLVWISRFERPTVLVDEMLSGPFTTWKQTRIVQPHREGATLTDVVEYSVPFGVMGRIADAFLIRPAVYLMFRQRQRATQRILAGVLKLDEIRTQGADRSSGTTGSVDSLHEAALSERLSIQEHR